MPSNRISPGGTKITASPYGLGTWQPSVAASATAGGGDNTACSNGTLYYASIWIPGDLVVTGIQYLVGNTGGTNRVVASLHNSAGELLANTAVSGPLVGTQNTIQQVALTVPYYLNGPGLVLVGLTFNGNTAKFSTVPAYCHLNTLGGSATQTYGTPASFVPSATTFTVNTAPIAALY